MPESYKRRAGKKKTEVYGLVTDPMFRNDNEGTRYPRSVIYFKTAEAEGKVLHSTQKPIELLMYLIKTYTKPGDIVLDPTAGSGTTAVACSYSQRKFIGYELDEAMYKIAYNRIQNSLDVFS